MKAPLRRVVESYIDERSFEMERLECGHNQRRKADIYGLTNAYRRRCRKCKDTILAEAARALAESPPAQ